MPLPENHCSTLFTTGYKRLTEGGCEAFSLWAFAFGLLVFWCGRLFFGGKGKELLKGKDC
jgi:hypothetical protein